MREREYWRADAAAYAKAWAFGRNPAYLDFEQLGGDCTNFASQCLYAGSGIMNYTPTFGWYYASASNRTPPWTGVQYLYDFLTRGKGPGPHAVETEAGELEIGDLVQLGRADGQFYHSPVVVETSPELLVAAHSFDAYRRPLSSYSYDRVRYLHIAGVRIP